MLEDHGQPGPTGLDPAARILHVVTTTRGVIGEVAVDAIRGHLTAGRQVALAARPSVIRRLDLPESRDLATIPIGARDRVTGADPGSSLTLHQHYRHVDVVHAHGLHAAALAGAAMTGLPARMRPALVATIGRFRGSNVVDGASAKIVERTASVVLGTTDPTTAQFADAVPITERAQLRRPDVLQRLAPVVDRAQVRENLAVPPGSFLVATPMRLVDGDALTTFLESAVTMFDHRPDRRVVFALTGTGRERSTIANAFTRTHPVVLADEGSAVDVLAAADVVVASNAMTAVDVEGLMQLGRATVVLGDARMARPWGDAAPRVAPDDTNGLLRALTAYLDSPQERTSAAFAVRRRVDDVDAGALIAEDLLDVYAEALTHRR